VWRERDPDGALTSWAPVRQGKQRSREGISSRLNRRFAVASCTASGLAPTLEESRFSLGQRGQASRVDLALRFLTPMALGLSPEEESRLRLRIVRQVAADIAEIIADAELSEVNGNVHLPKPPLVSALSRYFEQAGADGDTFIARCYGG